ncbi:hypothetical protein CHK_1395 [Christensenella hongkongensis]|uniref:Uncharacterized protein n=1 Tax=Christensenella hongkongensis TaxID=270498 RepID=A0A0M2NFS9_9FIRM|nr:hypothetical protein CHK_1395 [Christensenella hongkongensis]
MRRIKKSLPPASGRKLAVPPEFFPAIYHRKALLPAVTRGTRGV